MTEVRASLPLNEGRQASGRASGLRAPVPGEQPAGSAFPSQEPGDRHYQSITRSHEALRIMAPLPYRRLPCTSTFAAVFKIRQGRVRPLTAEFCSVAERERIQSQLARGETSQLGQESVIRFRVGPSSNERNHAPNDICYYYDEKLRRVPVSWASLPRGTSSSFKPKQREGPAGFAVSVRGGAPANWRDVRASNSPFRSWCAGIPSVIAESFRERILPTEFPAIGMLPSYRPLAYRPQSTRRGHSPWKDFHTPRSRNTPPS